MRADEGRLKEDGLDEQGASRGRVLRNQGGALGWTLSGTLVRRFDGRMAVVSYLVETDRRWRTEKASVK